MGRERSRWLPILLAAAFAGAACTSQRAPNATGADGPTAAAAQAAAMPEQLRTVEVASRRGVVVTGSAAASWAGARVLESGGNAVDAAVAAAFALGVAEPGSSGVGGQTYLLVHMRDGRTVAIDGSARAPLRCAPAELDRLQEATQAIRPGSSVHGYKSIATPGTVAALDLALRRFGSKSLAEVLGPAIEIAELGSTWTASHHAFLVDYTTKVRESSYLSNLFLKDFIDVWGTDHVYCNPDLACFLRRLAAEGAGGFYRGAIAAEIVADMVANDGWLRRGDLAMMEAEVVEPVRGRYRGLDVLSFPNPGGGATVVEALGILDRFDPGILRTNSTDRLHLLAEACRLAFADSFPARRPQRLPDELAADPGHIARRAGLIRFDRALHAREISSGPLSMLEVGGTTQVSVADAAGNVASLTQTLGATFGSKVATAGFGFAYNSLLNGFDFRDPRAWSYITPLQAPRNSMAPTIVVDDGRPLLVLGSAGSSRIAPAIVNAIVALVDGRLPLGEAIAAPRVLWGGNLEASVFLEMVNPITEGRAAALARRGFTRQKRLTYPASDYDLTEFGGVNAILIDPATGTMVGVGDPRRQGVAQAAVESAGAAPPLVLPDCPRTR